MAWVDEDIEVGQNEDFNRTVLIVNKETSGFFNYTGASAKLSVRQAWSNGAAEILAVSSGGMSPQITFEALPAGDIPAPAYNNAYKFFFTAAQLLALIPGTYYYDFLLIWADGTHSYLQRGEFVVVNTAARYP